MTIISSKSRCRRRQRLHEITFIHLRANVIPQTKAWHIGRPLPSYALPPTRPTLCHLLIDDIAQRLLLLK